jgi:competence protein ComEA
MGLTVPAFAADSAVAPVHSGLAAASASASAPAKKQTSVVPSSQQLDINSASRQKLKTLPGIGDAEAAKIMAGRPYYSKTDLVTRKVLPEGSYAAIKYRIFAAPPAVKSSSKL